MADPIITTDPTEAAERVAERLVSMIDEPAEAVSDGQSARNQPIPDLIELDRYLRGKAALGGTPSRSAWRCTRPARAVPPGCS